MMFKPSCKYFALLSLLALLIPHPGIAGELPNIVVILADDYGYGSSVCYGADPHLVSTPNIDKLAEQGMKFLDANTPSSVCSPTRYALLTGRYCWRSVLNDGTTVWTLDPLIIEPNRPTVASMLKSKGYSTGFVGKWHLGYGTAPRVDFTAELKPGPLELGFDYQFAVPQNHNDFTRVFIENHYVYGLRSRELNQVGGLNTNGKLGLDAPERNDPETMGVLTQKAIEWLERIDKDQPFFLYFAPVAVHGRITPSAETAGTTKAGPYGDFIRDLDISVGRLLRTLDQLNVDQETIVIFTSDNGGVSPGRKGSAENEAVSAGLKINGELSGGKHDIWQGGFKVPMVVRWPGKVEPGSETDSMVGLVDIYATLAEIVDASSDSSIAAGPDSYSFLADLLETGTTSRKSLIFHSSDGVYAIRYDKWKFVEGFPAKYSHYNKKAKADQYKEWLIDLESDPMEKNNLAGKNDKLVTALRQLLTLHRNQGYSR